MRTTMRLVLLLLAVIIPAPLSAETPPADIKGLWLTADYPAATVRAGDEARFNLSLINYRLAPQRADLAIENPPKGWEVELRGGGRPVAAAFADSNAKSNLELKIKVPSDTKPGRYTLLVKATAADGVRELPLALTVEERPEATLTAEPKLPTLRGTPRSTFDFRVTIKNDSADAMLVNLSAQAPRGFQVTFKEGYGSQELTSLPIKAGESKDLAVDVKPPQSIAAGQYPVVVSLASERAKVETKLVLDITGQPSVNVTGENDRLSGEASAGTEKTFTFVVRNTGSAEARNLTFSASPPSGWKVTFEPKELAVLEPNAEQKITAIVMPSEKALAGDYVMAVRANGDGISESVNYRVTVVTSTMWGIVGLGVIAASLLVLLGAVGRFGRR
jgi:uncharacterized repeat protein (TIGR01451 family)